MYEQRFTVLDSCRGICALLVAVFHFGTLGQVLGVDFVRHSWIFVDFFFLLSGFVITHAYAHRLGNLPDMATFAIRRLGRIWPLHLFVLALLIGLEAVKTAVPFGNLDRVSFTGPAAMDALAHSALLLNSTPLWPGQSINGPSWSISSEFWTYLIYAAVLVATASVARPGRLRTAVLSAVWISATALLIWGAGRMETYAEFAIARCLFGFLAGCLTHRIWYSSQTGQQARRPLVASLTECAVLVGVVLFVTFWAATPLQFLAPLVFGAAVLVFAEQAGMVSRLLSRRPFRILGTLSFSIYMTHSFLREVLRWGLAALTERTGIVIILPLDLQHLATIESDALSVVAGGWGAYGLLLVFLGCTLGLSALTYRFIELPGQSAFRSLANRISARTAPGNLTAPPQALSIHPANMP